jgi:hypothetical protein
MEALKAIARFVLAQIAILAFLAAAPALMLIVPFMLIAHGDRNLGGLAFLYMAAGPFVSAVWTAFFMSFRRVKRMTTFGNRGAYNPFTVRVQLISCGWMLYGFFGTLVAEAAFVLLFHSVSRSPLAFFAVAPFAVFSPLFLLWARNT